MTIRAFECPLCLKQTMVTSDDRVDQDDHGRPICPKDGMPMLPVTLTRDEPDVVYASSR